jgi:hypothetical protein
MLVGWRHSAQVLPLIPFVTTAVRHKVDRCGGPCRAA